MAPKWYVVWPELEANGRAKLVLMSFKTEMEAQQYCDAWPMRDYTVLYGQLCELERRQVTVFALKTPPRVSLEARES